MSQDLLQTLEDACQALDDRHFPLAPVIDIKQDKLQLHFPLRAHYTELVDALRQHQHSLDPSIIGLMGLKMRELLHCRQPRLLEAHFRRPGHLRFELSGDSPWYDKKVPAVVFTTRHWTNQRRFDHFTTNTAVHEAAHQFYLYEGSGHYPFFAQCAALDKLLRPDGAISLLEDVRLKRGYEKEKNRYYVDFKQMERQVQTFFDLMDRRMKRGPGQSGEYLRYEEHRFLERKLPAELFCIANEYWFADQEEERRPAPVTETYIKTLVGLESDIFAQDTSHATKERQHRVLTQRMKGISRTLFGLTPPTIEEVCQTRISKKNYHRCVEDFTYQINDHAACFQAKAPPTAYQQMIAAYESESDPERKRDLAKALEDQAINAIEALGRDLRRQFNLPAGHVTAISRSGALGRFL